jgi:acyl-CoA synthetase (NDP forming)
MSVNNPVDLGLASVFEVDLYRQESTCVGPEPGVDALIFQGRGATPELDIKYATLLVEAQQKIRKPFLVISLGGLYLEQKSGGALINAEIPAYPSAERAIWAYANLSRYGEKQFHG